LEVSDELTLLLLNLGCTLCTLLCRQRSLLHLLLHLLHLLLEQLSLLFQQLLNLLHVHDAVVALGSTRNKFSRT